MMRIFYFLVLVAINCALIPPGLWSAQKQESMIRDLETICGIFKNHYAPIDWKARGFGWDLDAETEKARARILANENLTTKEYQGILLDFVGSTKDHHVQILFYSTESANLPFAVKSAEGKYFIVYVDKEQLSSSVYPLEIGDELVLFNGRPTGATIEEIKKYQPGSNPATENGFAEMYLTQRHGALGHVVPRGPIEIQVRHTQTGKLSSYQLIWNYTPEKINNQFGKGDNRDNLAHTDLQPLLQNPFFNKEMVPPAYHTLKKANNAKQCSHFLGARKSFIPRLGQVWWTAPQSSRFHAYLFETNDHKLIGYVRIPSYLGGSEAVLEDFASIIELFEARADALVIDQINNPGGSLFYLYALASMLTDQPLITPKHRQKLSQSEIFFANMAIPVLERVQSDEDARELLGPTHEGNEVTFQMAKFLLNYMYFLVDEWNAGRQFTRPYYLEGIDHINPHPATRFTKPVLVLTNAMDMSGGDFLPAILQDNKRATIFGERTAGAGGYVSQASFMNLNGILGFHITGSIAERADFSPIENLGVTPDIPYTLTADDFQYGYTGYKKAILEALEDIFY